MTKKSEIEIESFFDSSTAGKIQAFEMIRRQHTELHRILYKIPRGSNPEIVKQDISRVIAALIQTIILI